MDQIIQRMPLAVYARIVAIREPIDDPLGVIKATIECSSTSSLPLCRQNIRVLRHLFADRSGFALIRSFMFGLRCMGLVR
jgi:hypothetical protein